MDAFPTLFPIDLEAYENFLPLDHDILSNFCNFYLLNPWTESFDQMEQHAAFNATSDPESGTSLNATVQEQGQESVDGMEASMAVSIASQLDIEETQGTHPPAGVIITSDAPNETLDGLQLAPPEAEGLMDQPLPSEQGSSSNSKVQADEKSLQGTNIDAGTTSPQSANVDVELEEENLAVAGLIALQQGVPSTPRIGHLHTPQDGEQKAEADEQPTAPQNTVGDDNALAAADTMAATPEPEASGRNEIIQLEDDDATSAESFNADNVQGKEPASLIQIIDEEGTEGLELSPKSVHSEESKECVFR